MARTGKASINAWLLVVLKIIIVIFQTIGRTTYRTAFFVFKSIFMLLKSFVKLFLNLVGKISKWQIKVVLPTRKKVKKKTSGKKGQKKFWLKRLLVFFVCLLFLFTLVISFYYWILQDLPKPDRLLTYQPPLTTKLYDRSGQPLYKIYRDQNRTLVTLDKIPTHLINATIAIEDKHFFTHSGFSLEGITRALKQNIFQKQIEGGSTITQQLIKNTLLTPEKTVQRKIKELILSFQTELVFDKNEVLTMYLNTVPYGGTAYGVEAAAQTYFGKSVTELNLAETALLAGLPAAPSKYSPFGSNPELSIIRQHEVLRRMVEDGYITPFEAEEAKSTTITLAPMKNEIKAPHFVMYLKDYLAGKLGIREVEQGGLTVISSLDLTIQQMAEETVQDELIRLAPMNVTNGAALVIKPSTGEILAMVGSKNYYDINIDGNVNVVLQPRQPGSTIKITNYAYALSHGYTAASIISDTPISYRIPGQPAYKPVNYDNRWHGNVTLRQALACSYNIPAVKVLASYGVNKMIDQAQAMGITTWNDRSRFGLSLTLGGGEVKMIDLATAYGVLANYGQKIAVNPVLAVRNRDKKIILQNTCWQGLVELTSPLTCLAKDNQPSDCIGQTVISPEIAFILTNILSDNNARMPAFGTNSLLNIRGHQVAVKTGTTNDKRDNWCIGYTTDYLVAVWVGNNDNQPMSAVTSGITGATPIWHDIMTELLSHEPQHHFPVPDDIVKLSICPVNGLRACDGCPNRDEYFIKGTEPKYSCNSFEVQQKIVEEEKSRQNQILEGLSTSN